MPCTTPSDLVAQPGCTLGLVRTKALSCSTNYAKAEFRGWDESAGDIIGISPLFVGRRSIWDETVEIPILLERTRCVLLLLLLIRIPGSAVRRFRIFERVNDPPTMIRVNSSIVVLEAKPCRVD